MENNIKVVFFDMEGTLFKPTAYRAGGSFSHSAWTSIEEKLGIKEAGRALFRKWKEGGYTSIDELTDETNRLYQQAGLTESVFRNIIESIEYFPGVHETFDLLHKAGHHTALITGGFYDHAQRAVNDLGIHHAFSACRYFWDEQGNLSHWEAADTDFVGKVHCRDQVARLYNAQPNECAFVGDGSNDVHIARAVGMSIAFNADKELQEVATHCVNQERGKEDFRAVLEYLLPYELR